MRLEEFPYTVSIKLIRLHSGIQRGSRLLRARVLRQEDACTIVDDFRDAMDAHRYDRDAETLCLHHRDGKTFGYTQRKQRSHSILSIELEHGPIVHVASQLPVDTKRQPRCSRLHFRALGAIA